MDKNKRKREKKRDAWFYVKNYVNVYSLSPFSSKFPHNIRNSNFVTLKVISISTVCIIAICHLNWVTVKNVFQISLFHCTDCLVSISGSDRHRCSLFQVQGC